MAEDEIIVCEIYCSLQGPGSSSADDHVDKLPPQESHEGGEPDEHGGQILFWPDGTAVGCSKCVGVLYRRRRS